MVLKNILQKAKKKLRGSQKLINFHPLKLFTHLANKLNFSNYHWTIVCGCRRCHGLR
jgi:hypothetical protein